MKTEDITVGKVMAGLIAYIVLIPYSMILNGWAFAKLWAWFIVPSFGLPLLSIPVAMGVALVVTYLTYQVPNSKSDYNMVELLFRGFSFATFKPLICLGTGYIIKCWM